MGDQKALLAIVYEPLQSELFFQGSYFNTASLNLCSENRIGVLNIFTTKLLVYRSISVSDINKTTIYNNKLMLYKYK